MKVRSGDPVDSALGPSRNGSELLGWDASVDSASRRIERDVSVHSASFCEPSTVQALGSLAV